ncbi:uncharacterized protein LOC123263177 isoform X6 [Cotesia glomerata]|uniref:uncharacterized protein LOC123263177 isoform X6 n=1 Tax=Cotesia glomerata TaxID=32391 RepID=UPI001D016E23|nr:uncharacterized protein LOC123263177 isoform X6 [Cotesia glomerata]
MTIPQVGYNILFSDKNCHQKMDPVKSYTDYRLGSRKSWEDLSSERKRKLRKLHFDSLDRKLLLHHRNLNSNYKLYGPLDSISAFPYENQMPKFRDFVRKPNKPLQQIFRRIQEEFQFTDTKENNYKHFKARNSHNCGPIPGAIENFSMQYENLQTPSFFLSLQNTDNTIITHSGQIGIIKNIIYYNNQYFLAIYFFTDLQPLYSVSNRPSTDFGVFLCTSLNDSKAVIITYDEVQSKCYRMPLWINKPFLDINSNDEQLNNAYVAVVM